MSDAEKEPNKESQNEQGEVFSTMHSLCNQLGTLETLMTRRFDEISMEINATSQQVDLAEEGIVKRFSEIVEVLSSISYSGDGSTPANAGVELDAVVDMTEDAANKILDAAGRISTRVNILEGEDDATKRNAEVEKINQDISEIYMACSFQDITGQRIRKTLDNLKLIENRLGGALERMGIQVNPASQDAPPAAASQGDVDDIFAEKRSTSGDKTEQ